MLHPATRVDDPAQVAPQVPGAGFVQVRVLDQLPPPQVLVQAPNGLQADQFPLTTAEIIGLFTLLSKLIIICLLVGQLVPALHVPDSSPMFDMAILLSINTLALSAVVVPVLVGRNHR